MNSFKEYLKELMDLNRECTIRFRSLDGGVSTIKAHIIYMENVSGRDIIETDAGLHIGVDQILDVNGRPAQYWS